MNFYQETIGRLNQKLSDTPGDPLDILREAMDSWEGANERKIFNLREVTLIETVELIRLLGNSTAFGHDLMDSQTIKLTVTSLYCPLNFLINLSIRSKRFASKWKIGRIVPLHKGKGLSPNIPESFRPVSLLSVTLKLVERSVLLQVMKYMEESKQINQLSNSYRKQHGTTMTLLEIADAIFTATDENQISTIGGKNCDMKPVETGSVLGPILFMIYVNELPGAMMRQTCKNDIHA